MRIWKTAVAVAITGAAAGAAVSEAEGPGSAQAPPLSYVADGARIELSALGSYDGGFYSGDTPASPPPYDPASRLAFTGSGDRGTIEAIDVSNPRSPRLRWAFDLSPWGSDANGLAARDGVVAATVRTGEPPARRGYLLLLSTAGRLLADPIELPDANKVAFTGDRSLVVSLPQYPSDDSTIDPPGGFAFIELGRRGHEPRVDLLTFESLDPYRTQLEREGIRFSTPGSSVSQDLEPENIKLSADGRDLWVTFQRNNAIGRIDVRRHRLVDLFSAGERDHSLPGHGLDVSDRDGGIAIRPWPLRSLPEPDDLDEYRFRGKRYLVTANEGDPRDSDGFSEKVRVGDVPLDPTAFPNGAELQRPDRLGRLQVTKVEGDPDGDGDLDRLVLLGSRSFSIYDDRGRLVYDSADLFEQVISRALPEHFNAAEDSNAPDTRSDDRGAEIEHLVLGRIGSRTYAFMAFERTGGWMSFDVTNPRHVRFQQYFNNRNFGIDPSVACGERRNPKPAGCVTGDSEPEGASFVPAEQSPNGKPLLIVNHELSDTVSVYEVGRRRE